MGYSGFSMKSGWAFTLVEGLEECWQCIVLGYLRVSMKACILNDLDLNFWADVEHLDFVGWGIANCLAPKPRCSLALLRYGRLSNSY